MQTNARSAREGAAAGTVGRWTLLRVVVLAVGVALLAPGMTHPVGAEDKDTGGAGTANVLVCESAGGEATVKSWGYGNGSHFVTVECNGGYLDGWDCYHSTATGTWQCSAAYVPDLPGKETLIDLGELGLQPAVLRSIPSRALPSLVAPRDGHDGGQAQHESRGKQRTGTGKHGKHGGQHRER
jgi:hypothetical protein